jgi:hypothetical protein
MLHIAAMNISPPLFIAAPAFNLQSLPRMGMPELASIGVMPRGVGNVEEADTVVVVGVLTID